MNEDQIYEYCVEQSTSEPDYLVELTRETYIKTMRPHMISGAVQGQLLRLLIKLFKSKNVLEIGTFTGYATLCMAAGLEADGKIYTIELEEEFSYFHDKYFEISGMDGLINRYYGDANEIIEKLDVKFDFVFMDAGKKDYKAQLEMLLSKMKKGGIILADNVLWKGKILDEEMDKMTRMIHDFNDYVKTNPKLDNLILPIRDGINIIVVR